MGATHHKSHNVPAHASPNYVTVVMGGTRPFRNITGVILFHAGRIEEALEVLHENARLGGPDGPHMAYYRAGTLARLGRTEEARSELEKASAFPYDFDMRNFLSAFRNPHEANELLDSLESVGFDSDVLLAPQTR